MTDRKLSELSDAGTLDGTETMYVVKNGNSRSTIVDNFMLKSDVWDADVTKYGAIGDDTVHTVEEWIAAGTYADLAAIQVDYPHVTSTSDTIDYAAIQKALNAGGAWLPPGTYIINRALLIPPTSKTFLLGTARSSTIETTSLTDDVVRLAAGASTPSMIEVGHLILDASSAQSSGCGIKTTNDSGGTFYFCNFHDIRVSANVFSGVDISAGYWWTFTNILLLCAADGSFGMRLKGTATDRISNVYMRSINAYGDSTPKTNMVGLLFDSYSEGIYLDTSTLEQRGLHYGLHIADSVAISSSRPRNIFLDRVIADATTGDAIRIDNVQTLRLSDSWATTSEAKGIYIAAGVDIEISGAAVINNNHEGLHAESGVKQLRVLGGVYDANSGATTNTYAAIRFAAGITDFSVIGAAFIRSGTSLRHHTDIMIEDGASNRYTITGNMCTGWITYPIYDGGTGTDKTIESNTGYSIAPVDGLHNRVLNPCGEVAVLGLGSTADAAYTGFDQWYALTEANPVTSSQLTAVENGMPFAMRLTQSNASAQRFGIAQPIEMTQCRDLRGKRVALSARVRMSASTTLRYAVLEWTGTADAPTKDIVNDWSSSTFTTGNFFISTTTTLVAAGSVSLTADTFQNIALRGAISSSVSNLIVVFWTDSQQAQNVTLDVTNVQLENAWNPSRFEWRDPLIDRTRLQRYIYVLGSMSLAGDGTTRALGGISLPLRLLKTPTVSSIGAAAVTITNTSADFAQSSFAVTAGGLGPTGGHIRLENFTGLTAGADYVLHGTTGPRLYFDARM